MDLGITPRLEPLLKQVKSFIADEIVPLEKEFFAEVEAAENRWAYTPRMAEILEGLKVKAKGLGLWNFWLTQGDQGCGLTTVEYAYLAEAMGHAHLAPEVFNCSAPDTGNMEVLHRYGSPEQQARWLTPLINGEIRSAYAMTEPDAACSDATNIACSAVLDGDEYVVNGEKTYISGAGDPRCKIIICMVLTNAENPRHQQHSQILIPMDTPGVEIVRPMHVFSLDDAPHGHMQIRFNDVRVPQDHLLLEPGRGFEIAQGRLGPGRIHHCMRALGSSERALELLCRRGLQRKAFGKRLVELGANYDIIANARMRIDMGRLLTLRAAWTMDNAGTRAAGPQISAVKTVVPELALDIIDEAMQMFGAAGLSQDTPLAHMYMQTRTLRLADGPDAVHRRQVARAEIGKYA